MQVTATSRLDFTAAELDEAIDWLTSRVIARKLGAGPSAIPQLDLLFSTHEANLLKALEGYRSIHRLGPGDVLHINMEHHVWK